VFVDHDDAGLRQCRSQQEAAEPPAEMAAMAMVVVMVMRSRRRRLDGGAQRADGDDGSGEPGYESALEHGILLGPDPVEAPSPRTGQSQEAGKRFSPLPSFFRHAGRCRANERPCPPLYWRTRYANPMPCPC